MKQRGRQKRVPSEVFMLTRSQVALFLNRLRD